MAIDKLAADSSGAPKHCGRSGMGKQADSKKKTAPAHSFSHMADREAASKTFLSAAHNNVELRCRGSPGAIYSVRSSIDTQADKATAPKFTFNKTERLKVPLSRPVCVCGYRYRYQYQHQCCQFFYIRRLAADAYRRGRASR